MSKVYRTGNLFQNNYITTKGEYENYPEVLIITFIGYIGKVPIWNITRKQNQIITNMNATLLNPSSISGLLAYYTFDDLKNKQGNAT